MGDDENVMVGMCYCVIQDLHPFLSCVNESNKNINILFGYIFKMKTCITSKGFGRIWYMAWTLGI